MRAVFYVSDRTGVTAETVGQSLLSQFEDVEFGTTTIPFVAGMEVARDVVERINASAASEGEQPIVFCTVVDPAVRAIIRQAQALFLDFFSVFLSPLETELNQKSSETSGRSRTNSAADAVGEARIDATNFALANDDGAGARDYDGADVILVGVSRSGKTPTSLYMALHYGIFAANYPITEDELESGKLPQVLLAHKRKLHGLTIHPTRLQQIRSERRPGSRYASSQQIQYEVRSAEALYRRLGLSVVDVTECSVEEIASRVIHRMNLVRRLRT